MFIKTRFIQIMLVGVLGFVFACSTGHVTRAGHESSQDSKISQSSEKGSPKSAENVGKFFLTVSDFSNEDQAAISKIKVTLTAVEGDIAPLVYTFDPSAKVEIGNIPVGVYSLVLELIGADGKVYKKGEATVKIEAGVVVETTVEPKPVDSGTGGIIIHVPSDSDDPQVIFDNLSTVQASAMWSGYLTLTKDSGTVLVHKSFGRMDGPSDIPDRDEKKVFPVEKTNEAIKVLIEDYLSHQDGVCFDAGESIQLTMQDGSSKSVRNCQVFEKSDAMIDYLRDTDPTIEAEVNEKFAKITSVEHSSGGMAGWGKISLFKDQAQENVIFESEMIGQEHKGGSSTLDVNFVNETIKFLIMDAVKYQKTADSSVMCTDAGEGITLNYGMGYSERIFASCPGMLYNAVPNLADLYRMLGL